ncbi:MAG: thioredoxin family protein [Actinomycetota bacterium]|nr:thioredoxin family protein [Actinomycetota bacterium]
MHIRVLGPGCANCTTLASRTREALDRLGLDADVVDEHDLAEIAAAGVMSTPALEVDGRVVISGRVATTDELADLLGARWPTGASHPAPLRCS